MADIKISELAQIATPDSNTKNTFIVVTDASTTSLSSKKMSLFTLDTLSDVTKDHANSAFFQANAAFLAANTGNSAAANLVLDVSSLRNTVNLFTAAVGGNVNIEIDKNTNYFFSANATANVTFNAISNTSAGGMLNTRLAIGEKLPLVIDLKIGTNTFMANLHIDSVLQSPRFKNGVEPNYFTSQPGSIHRYEYEIIKTAANTYTVMAANTTFKV